MSIKNILFLIFLVINQKISFNNSENLSDQEIAETHLKENDLLNSSKIEVEVKDDKESFQDHGFATIARIKNETEANLEILNTEELSDQLSVQIKNILNGQFIQAELAKDSQDLSIGTFPTTSYSESENTKLKLHKISKNKKQFFAIESEKNKGSFLTKMPNKTIEFISGNPKKNTFMLWKITKNSNFFNFENFNGGFATLTNKSENFVHHDYDNNINFGDLVNIYNTENKNIEKKLIFRPASSNNKNNHHFQEKILNGSLIQLEEADGERININKNENWIVTFLDNKKNLEQDAAFLLTTTSDSQLLTFENNKLTTKKNNNDFKNFTWKATIVKKPKYEIDNVLQAGLFQGADYQNLSELKNKQLFEIEKASQDKNIIKPKADSWVNHDIQISSLNIKGFSKEILENFHSGLELAIPPMINQGVAWLEDVKQNKNDFSCSFLLKTDYNSDFSVWLANQNKDLKFKIIFGSSQGLFSQIIKYKDGNSMQVDVQDHSKNYSSKILPGNYQPFWISVTKAAIYAGYGFRPGENVFMCANLNEEKISRVGFSCNKNGAYLAQIQMQDAIKPNILKKEYWTSKNTKPNLGFKALESGSVQITNPSDDFFVEMENLDEKQKYKIEFNNQEQKIIIRKNERKLHEKKTNFENIEKLFISKKNNLIVILNQNLEEILVFKDNNSIKKIDKINTNSNLQIKILPEIFFEIKSSSISPYYKGKVLVNKPYQYSVWQEGKNIFFSDQIYNYTDIVTQVQQKKASYDLILKINSNGTPSMRWAWQPENESLVSLNRNAMFLAMTAEALNLASSHTEGSGKIGQMIGSALSIGIAGSSIIPRNFAIKMQANAKYDYKKAQSNFNALGLKQNQLETIINQEVEKNKNTIDELLTKASHWKGSTQSKIDALIPIYKQILQLIIHPNIVEKQGEKNVIIQGIINLYNSYQELYRNEEKISSNVDIEMFGLITNALANNLLLDLNNQSENQNYQIMVGIASQIMQKLIKNKKLILDKNSQEVFWTNKKIDPKKTSITLAVKGSGELILALSDFIESTSSKNFDGYIVTIQNGLLKLKLNNSGSIIKEIKIPELEINNIIGTKIILKYENNILEIFLDNFEKPIISWENPYPSSQTKYFGIGSSQGSFNILSIE